MSKFEKDTNVFSAYAMKYCRKISSNLTIKGNVCAYCAVGGKDELYPTVIYGGPHLGRALNDRSACSDISRLVKQLVKKIEDNPKLSKLIADVQYDEYKANHGEEDGTNKIGLVISGAPEDDMPFEYFVYLTVEQDSIRIGTYVTRPVGKTYFVDPSAIWLWLTAANQLVVVRNQIPMMEESRGSKYEGGASSCRYVGR